MNTYLRFLDLAPGADELLTGPFAQVVISPTRVEAKKTPDAALDLVASQHDGVWRPAGCESAYTHLTCEHREAPMTKQSQSEPAPAKSAGERLEEELKKLGVRHLAAARGRLLQRLNQHGMDAVPTATAAQLIDAGLEAKLIDNEAHARRICGLSME